MCLINISQRTNVNAQAGQRRQAQREHGTQQPQVPKQYPVDFCLDSVSVALASAVAVRLGFYFILFYFQI